MKDLIIIRSLDRESSSIGGVSRGIPRMIQVLRLFFSMKIPTFRVVFISFLLGEQWITSKPRTNGFISFLKDDLGGWFPMTLAPSDNFCTNEIWTEKVPRPRLSWWLISVIRFFLLIKDVGSIFKHIQPISFGLELRSSDLFSLVFNGPYLRIPGIPRDYAS